MPGAWEPIRKQSLGNWIDVNCVHAINLRLGDGTDRVMLFSYGAPPTPGPALTNIFLWDRSSAAPIQSVSNNSTNLLCAGHSHAADGKVVFAGGHWDPVSGPNGIPPKDLNLFDPTNLSAPWAPRAAMLRTRWYPTCTTLPRGKSVCNFGRTAA